ncbi:MAG: hypothetical protein PHX43_03545 [Alphaproteobacteria bacterium]|nr:hypothetical protein [Alphaproteobacteria bacterium]
MLAQMALAPYFTAKPIINFLSGIVCEVSDLLPVRLSGSAYHSNPREAEHRIFTVLRGRKEEEYLVCVNDTFKNGRVIKSEIMLGDAKRILARPKNKFNKPTCYIKEMLLSDDIPPDVMDALSAAIRWGYRPRDGYEVEFR